MAKIRSDHFGNNRADDSLNDDAEHRPDDGSHVPILSPETVLLTIRSLARRVAQRTRLHVIIRREPGRNPP